MARHSPLAISSLAVPPRPTRGRETPDVTTYQTVSWHRLHRVLIVLAAGCGAPVRKPAVPVFFPPAPDAARIQYLVSFSGLKDIEEQSAFNRFVVGEKQDVKVDKPYGVAIYDGKIYVCDTNGTVYVFDLKARIFAPLKGAVGQGTLSAAHQHQHRPRRHQVRDRSGPRPGRRVRPQRRVRHGLRGAGGVAAGRRRRRSKTGCTSPTSANGLVKVFDTHDGRLIKAIGDKGDAVRTARPADQPGVRR